MELIELYEYKVADVLAGRVPRGGPHALNDLRDTLLAAPLEAPLRQRMMVTDRQYRAWRDVHEPASHARKDGRAEHFIMAAEGSQEGHMFSVPVPASEGTGGGETSKRANYGLPAPELPANGAAGEISIFGNGEVQDLPDLPALNIPKLQAAEQEAWQELSLLTWYDELYHRVLQESLQARNEPARPFLRIMYCVLENAELLGTGQALQRVPEAQDSRLGLHNEQVVRQQVEQFCSLFLAPQGRRTVSILLDSLYEDPLPRQEGRHDVAFNPFERPLLRGAVRQLQTLLEQYLVELPLLLDSSPPSGQIFYPLAEDNVVPAQNGDEVIVCLGEAPKSLRWNNVVLTWQPAEDERGAYWAMHVGMVPVGSVGSAHVPSSRPQPPAQQIIRLYPHDAAAQRIYTVRSGPLHLQIFLSSQYALMRLRTQPEQELGLLAVQARALALMLRPQDNYGFLRLARALARYLRSGELNVKAEGENVDNYTHAPADALQAFVRKGLSTLTEHIKQKEPREIADALIYCAEAMQLPAHMPQMLHEALHNAAFNMESISEPVRMSHYQEAFMVQLNGVFQSYHLERLPLNLDLQEGRMLTIQRDYRGELVALLPGHPAVSLERMAAMHVGALSVILVRQAQWLAVAAQFSSRPDAVAQRH